MARANVYKENQPKTKSKKPLFWSLISVGGLVVIAGVVMLILWGVGVFDKEVTPTYFTEYDNLKISYSEISTKTKDTEFAFIFVYDNESYDDLSSSDKSSISSQIASLLQTIDAKNEEYSDIINFYLIDSSATGNSSILDNTSYGSFTFTPQLLFFYGGNYYGSVSDAIEANQTLENVVSAQDRDLVFSATTVKSFVSVATNTKYLIQDLILSE